MSQAQRGDAVPKPAGATEGVKAEINETVLGLGRSLSGGRGVGAGHPQRVCSPGQENQ